jgi:hypothetical protein
MESTSLAGPVRKRCSVLHRSAGRGEGPEEEVAVSGYSAIAPGTDLSQHARVLQRVHDAVIGGGSPPVRPRGVVARSWTRVLGLGLDP